MKETFYDMLGVQPGADTSRIDAAFRTACAVVGGESKLPPETRLAHHVLSTPERQQAYHELLEASTECPPAPIAVSQARFYKLAAEEWGFEWEDTDNGTIFQHVGVARRAACSSDEPATSRVVPVREKSSLKLHDYLEEQSPPKREAWTAKPVVLGQRVYHLRPLAYRVQEAVFTSSHLQLHLESQRPLVLDLPELVHARGIRPGCGIMFCAMVDYSTSTLGYFTKASVYPYAGSNTPVMLHVNKMIDQWFAAAKRGVAPKYARKPPTQEQICRANFGVGAKDYERIVTTYEMATCEAILRYEADWLNISSPTANLKARAREFAHARLKQFWKIKRPPHVT